MTNNQTRIHKSLVKEGSTALYNDFILNNINDIEIAINKILETSDTINNNEAKLRYLREERHSLESKLAQQFSSK